MSTKNVQAETDKMCSCISSFRTKTAVFMKTSQNIYILKFNWHFLSFEYYHIAEILNSMIIKAKLMSPTSTHRMGVLNSFAHLKKSLKVA